MPRSPGRSESLRTSGVIWRAHDVDPADLPPLDVELAGWRVSKRRPSHVNASRWHAGREYHLKWFSRRLLGSNPARREHANARVVNALGIPSVVAVGWGEHPGGTFFVMEGSPGRSIFELDVRPSTAVIERMAEELGGLVARLHNANLCHRDLYVDHVLIHEDTIRLIDVERVMSFRRRRWIVKDLGGLLFSARRYQLPSSCARRFLRSYLALSRRRWSRHDLLAAVHRKALLYSRHNDGPPARRHLGRPVDAPR